ncbi:probable flavin-containing monooxygenase 1 [Arachis stenosperma]|uniref:probable flavin-containing monooxygenase 1 n=1 Tax=Arachis stenosperma TaxID=217475 RepID=UPI0025AD14DB|nr:probable flavin-containing monooxygenase 1 [Arachis stenosperma]
MAFQHKNYKVGIIGAGISGIAAAKQLCHYNPIVFESTDSIGGVWKHCSFNSTKLQTPRCDFEFSDFPWPQRDNSSFPSYIEVLEYLQNYATHFDVFKFVKFNSKVVQILHLNNHHHHHDHEYGRLLSGRPVWEVAVENNQTKIVEWYGFELLVVCIGKYGDIPIIPVYPKNKGPENFSGKVLHTMEYSKLDKESAKELLKGKKVAVVGYKKSAIDLAMECAQANSGGGGQPCTMVIRTLHWTVPSYWRKAISKFIESYLVWKLPLEKYGLKPEHQFVEDYASCQMAILPDNFFSEAEKGMIQFKKVSSSKWWFWKNGIEFEDKTKLEADVVVLATGFDGKKKLQSLLPEPFRSLVVDQSGIMPLYRGTIHPLIPNMAFVGYIESISNLQTAELRCKWLARLADEQFKLPSVTKMIEQTTQEIQIMKRTTRFYKRLCISTFSINHNDVICQEMGLNPWRKTSLFSEAFSPYTSQDYYF